MISILFVDDEPGILGVVRLYIEEQRGFRIECASSGKEALRMMQETAFDVIVSDYMMPEMNGLELLKKIRKKNNSIPFIIFTGKGREEIVIEALNAGADFYLQTGGEPKAQFAELSHIIRKVVRQHRAEEELEVSEERYRRITEGLTDYLYTVRVKDGRAVSTTHGAACLVVTGYTAGEFAADPYLWIRMVFDEDRDRVISHFSGVLSGKPVPPIEHRIVRKDGRVRWVRDTPVLQLDPDGNLVSYDGVIKDITERKEEEETLQRLTEFQESVITNARVWLSVLDSKGKILVWNTAAEDISGYLSDEVIGQNAIWKLLYPEKNYRKQVTDTITRIIRDRKYLENFETIIRTKQGREKVISWNTKGISDSTGKIPAYIAIGIDVTDRKQAEDALRVHAEIERNMSEAVYLIRVSDGVIVYTNPAFERLFGYDPGELVGSHVSVINAPVEKDPKVVADEIISDLTQTGAWNGEVLSLKKDGTTFWSIATVITFEHPRFGKVWLSMHRDITERKIAEELLRATERRLSDLINFLPDATFAIDPEGKVIAWNRAIEEMTGVRAEDMLGKGNYEYALPFYGKRRPILIDLVMMQDPGLPDTYSSLQREGDAFTAETTWVRPGEKEIYLWGKSILFKNDQGAVVGAIESIRDITDRKTAEELLKESREKYRELVESISDVIFEIDHNGKITYISPVVHKVLEFEPEEVVGKYLIEFVYPGDRNLLVKRFSEPSEAILPPLDYRVTTKSGEVRWVRMQTTPVITEKTSGRARGTLIDITDRKRAETALFSANRKLNLLSGITRHDIKNQMTVLRGYTTLLEKKQPDPSFAEYFQKINASADRISASIQFTKIYESLGVNAAVWHDTVTIVDAAAKDVLFGNVRLKNDLPAETKVFADPLIIKVFYNLMENAVRHGETITAIRFTAETQNGEHLIVCEDDGVGVPADEKEKIFERGFGKNTGLGLTLSREILDITGITIRETGEPGKGARFEITVPKGAWRTAGDGA